MKNSSLAEIKSQNLKSLCERITPLIISLFGCCLSSSSSPFFCGPGVFDSPSHAAAIYVEELSSDGSVLASSVLKLEVIKTLEQRGMLIVTVKEKADYILLVSRKGKRSWRRDTKVALSNLDGEVVFTASTRSVGGAMKGVVEYVQKHRSSRACRSPK
jgi:hypothetical protein